MCLSACGCPPVQAPACLGGPSASLADSWRREIFPGVVEDCEGRGAARSGGNRTGAPGCRAPPEWDKRGASGLHALFPELVGAGSAAWRRVGTAGCGPRRGQGLPAVRARPGGFRGLGLLQGSAVSARLSPACTPGRLVFKCGLTEPARASMWAQGAGVCVSVRQ